MTETGLAETMPPPGEDVVSARPASILQPVPGNNAPDFLTIGHVTRDIHPEDVTCSINRHSTDKSITSPPERVLYSLGGTVTFAALTASRLGLKVAIVTCADTQLLAELPSHLPGIGLAVRPSPATTTFVNSYHEGFRTQYLRARADPLQFGDIPETWLSAPIVLLGPVAQEIPSEFPGRLADKSAVGGEGIDTRSAEAPTNHRSGTILAATPQGWLRRWDADGRIWPTPWDRAEEMLPLLDVLILSHDDLLPFAADNRGEADAILADWSHKVPLLVATDGRHGATLFQDGATERFPAYSANEVDPTGAGDVFAAAFLVHLYRHGDPGEAVDFANCVAACSIEYVGTEGIPTLEVVRERMKK